jgi:FixJ family two-component response regulator
MNLHTKARCAESLGGMSPQIICQGPGLCYRRGIAIIDRQIHMRVDRLVRLKNGVVLSGMSGPELAGRLQETHPDLTVIFMTGYPFVEVAADIAPVGHDMLLQKPVRIGALVGDVDRVLASSSRRV